VAVRALGRQGRDHARGHARGRRRPVFDSGVDHFETDDDGHVTAAVDPNGDRYECDFVGAAIGLTFNTEFLRGADLEEDNGIVVDEYMQTSVDDIYAAGDLTRFYDVLLGEQAQNGSWGSAKEQGRVAAINMAADEESEEFQWVSSYSITHFDFPFLSFGHPTLGDEHAERRYSNTEWRRVAFKDGKDCRRRPHRRPLAPEQVQTADARTARRC